MTATLEERFTAKVDRSGDCWTWTAYRMPNGYGQIDHQYAHRVAYELAFGAIPEGLDIDHLCRNRACVRPEHLEAVTHEENCRRAGGHSRPRKPTAACRRGHPRTPDNTGRNTYGFQICRPCHRENVARHRARHRQAA